MAGFADATGRFLPLVATLNAARVLDAAGAMLGVDHEELARLALSGAAPAPTAWSSCPTWRASAPPTVHVPTGAVHGLRLATSTPAHLARAAVEGMLCALADGLDALVAQGAVGQPGHPGRRRRPVRGRPPDRAGGLRRTGARAAAGGVRRRRRRPPGGLGRSAAEQQPPDWSLGDVETYEAPVAPVIREQYAAARDLTVNRPA